MHHAPSVTYPVGRSLLAGRIALGIWLGGAATCVAFLAQPVPWGWRHALAAVSLLGSGFAAAMAWWRSPHGILRWDGAQWHWEQEGMPGPGPSSSPPELRADLQRGLLLYWPAGSMRGRWLWLERARAPEHWDALRRAVYSRARTEVPPQADPPAACP